MAGGARPELGLGRGRVELALVRELEGPARCGCGRSAGWPRPRRGRGRSARRGGQRDLVAPAGPPSAPASQDPGAASGRAWPRRRAGRAGAAHDDRAPTGGQRRIDLGVGERHVPPHGELLRDRHDPEEPVLERGALGRRRRSRERLDAAVDLRASAEIATGSSPRARSAQARAMATAVLPTPVGPKGRLPPDARRPARPLPAARSRPPRALLARAGQATGASTRCSPARVVLVAAEESPHPRARRAAPCR